MHRLCLLALCLLAPAAPQDVPVSSLAPGKMAFDDGQDEMSRRLFRTTTLRRQINLAGWWDFVADPGDIGRSKNYAAGFPEPDTRLWVPGTWNAVARYWNYVGPAWYRRRFEAPQDGHLRLHFSSVFYFAQVWFDGEFLGEHEGGYLPFSFIVRGVKKGLHTVVVRADNRLGDTTL